MNAMTVKTALLEPAIRPGATRYAAPARPGTGKVSRANRARPLLVLAGYSCLRLLGRPQSYRPQQIVNQRMQQGHRQHFLLAADRHLIHATLTRSRIRPLRSRRPQLV